MSKKLKKLNTGSSYRPYKRLGILLVISSLFNPMLPDPAMAEELLRTLVVNGSGVEKIATSLAKVELGVEIQGKTVTEVQQQVAKQTSAVVNLLRSKDVRELQTSGFRLQPNYDISDNQRQLIGYIGTNIVSFSIPTEQVGTLLDEAVEAGASRIDGVSFTATPEAIAAAKQEALRQATTDAQTKANVVLDTLDLTSQEIVNIQIDNAGVSQPRPIARGQAVYDAESFSTPIIAGEQTVTASVTLQISY
jgi:uncharacterized protein YggE